MKNKLIEIFAIFALLSSQISFSSHEEIFFLCNEQPPKRRSARMGITPLHCAQKLEDAQKIVSYGPDINARDNNLLTPVQYMIYHNRKDIAQYLISIGARFNKVDRLRIAAIKRNKQKYPEAMQAYITEKFYDELDLYAFRHDRVDSQLFFTTAKINQKLERRLQKKAIHDQAHQEKAITTSRRSPNIAISQSNRY